MDTNLLQLCKETQKLEDIYQPVLFRLSDENDRKALDQLAATGNIFVHDEIYDQLKELLKGRNPRLRATPELIDSWITTHLNGCNIADYGVWVYYSWSRRLLHTLDESEFIEVRTSRNQYKITTGERDRLATKKVGVIGLSVGQSVALTMAMERSFGEIRLADFDVLELTNLNRIRTGLCNLGIKKVIIVAREIAEIDPYIKVVLFKDGLTEANMDAYFTGGGKLDVLIDECDGVDIKILCRHKAKELQIPVLMEASDRTTIDVERFDLEPNRSILHGFIDHLDVSKLKDLKTNEERVPFLAPMVGIETMSVRLKASAIEVGQSITTWPQLASAVALGGGAVADIWRRIALDQYHESGRYFVDMEEIAGDKPDAKKYNPDDHIPVRPVTDHEALQLARGAVKPEQGAPVAPGTEALQAIIAAASAAPSGGNSQPWKWVFDNGILTLIHDEYYSYSFMDFQNRSSYVALGSAIENVVLKTHQLGLEVKVDYFPSDNRQVIANLIFYAAGSNTQNVEQHIADDLAPYIGKRHTNRKITPKTPVAAELLLELKQIGETIPGAKVQLFEKQEELDVIGDVISATDKFRLTYPDSHNDFTYQEMRWTEAEALDRRTGMEITTLELMPSELVGLKLIRDPKVVAFLRSINGGDVFRNVSRKCMGTASAAGFLSMPSFSEIDFVQGGRAGQRIWLKATQSGLAFHVMNVPIPFFQRLRYAISDLPPEITNELQQQYGRLNTILKMKETAGDVYLFRVFNAPATNTLPLLRNTDEILIRS